MADFAQVRVHPPCPTHPKVDAVFVCLENGCQESLACPECIVDEGGHHLHKVALLKKHLDTFKKRVNDFNTNTRETVLAPLKVIGSNVADELSAFDPATTTMLEKIEARGTKIHSHIDTLITEIKAKYSEIRASNRQLLKQYQRDVRARITEIEADLSSLGNCLTVDCTADIVNAAKTGISKTYSCLEYPNGIQDVSFKESNAPVNAVSKLIGKIQIGNEQQAWEEPDDEKIKRLEGQVTELTQQLKRDHAIIQKMRQEMMGNAERMETYQNHIQEMKKQMEASAERMDTDKDRIKTLQEHNERLAGELRNQKRVSEKRSEDQEQKIQELEKRLRCSGCGEASDRCKCITCPKCSYKGTDFKPPYDRRLLLYYRPRVRCPKCNHDFSPYNWLL